MSWLKATIHFFSSISFQCFLSELPSVCCASKLGKRIYSGKDDGSRAYPSFLMSVFPLHVLVRLLLQCQKAHGRMLIPCSVSEGNQLYRCRKKKRSLLLRWRRKERWPLPYSGHEGASRGKNGKRRETDAQRQSSSMSLCFLCAERSAGSE